MKRTKQMAATVSTVVKPTGNITPLIDLFVEMCFENIQNDFQISQFKLVGMQLGYTESETERVVEIGKLEYQTLLDEINQRFKSSVVV
tara:strand:+ start:13201 stop:13464 length:264 start_codon:yes stop_codon:yes gene_type:complete